MQFVLHMQTLCNIYVRVMQIVCSFYASVMHIMPNLRKIYAKFMYTLCTLCANKFYAIFMQPLHNLLHFMQTLCIFQANVIHSSSTFYARFMHNLCTVYAIYAQFMHNLYNYFIRAFKHFLCQVSVFCANFMQFMQTIVHLCILCIPQLADEGLGILCIPQLADEAVGGRGFNDLF